jgi:hypothetical protein
MKVINVAGFLFIEFILLLACKEKEDLSNKPGYFVFSHGMFLLTFQ